MNKNKLTLAVALLSFVLATPFMARAVAVTWDYSSTVLKPLAAVLGSRTSIGTTTATTNATLTVSATSTDTTTVLSLLKSTGAGIFSALANGNVGVGSTTPYSLLSIGGNVVVGASTAGGTLGDLYLPKLGTAAGTIIAVDANGMVIATSTTSGVTSVTGTYPVVSSGGATPAISLAFGTTTSNTWAGLQSFGNATTSLLTVSGSTWLTGITSAIALTGSTGLVAEYAGASCTNQFIRSLDAVGAATCATVGAGDVSLANLTATDGTLTFSGTYTGATARTIGVNLGQSNTWTGGQSFGNSTTTGTFTIPVGASVVTPSAGNMAVDTTSGQLRYADVAGTVRVVTGNQYPAFSYATSTAWVGTTTIPLGTARVAETWNDVQCYTDAGTLQVSFYDGTNRMNFMNASTTANTNTLTTNNTFTSGEKRYVDVGTPATSPTKISCTISKSVTSD